MFARYYGVGMARFLSADPTMQNVNVNDPQSWNRFVYASNNPLKYVDPDGLATTTKVDVISDTEAKVTETTTTTDKHGDTTTETTESAITVNTDGSVTETVTTTTSSTANPGAASTSSTTTNFSSAEAYAVSKDTSVKAGVDLSDISAASVATIGVVAGAAKNQGLPAPVITSGREGPHKKGSLHFSVPSKALDYRGNNIKESQLRSFAQAVRVGLGSKYDSIAEFSSSNPAFDHLHVEYDP